MIKGEPIASIRPHPAGDHLHFELWHWIAPSPQGDTDTEAVPVDPTRLLYHWEQALDLDYAVLGSIDAAAAAELDAETAGATLTAAYLAAEIALPSSPQITALASGCVWRITGTDAMHLLRAERGAITVIEEAYGHRTINPSSIDRLGLTRLGSYPTFLVEADGLTYGVPLHQAPMPTGRLSTCSVPPSALATASSWRCVDLRSGAWMVPRTSSLGSGDGSSGRLSDWNEPRKSIP